MEKTSNLVCYFDGCCEPHNPGGNMGIGACIRQNELSLFTHAHFIPAHFDNSNNVAEYLAFESLLDWLLEQSKEELYQELKADSLLKYNSEKPMVEIFGDSMLVVAQMCKQWKIKNGRYVYFAERCSLKLSMAREFYDIKIGWVRRTENKYADELSKSQLIKNNVEFKIQPLDPK
jgi:ribonuclease HI